MLPDWIDDASNIGQLIELGLIVLGIVVLSTGRPRAAATRWLAEHAPSFLQRGSPVGTPFSSVEVAAIYEGTDVDISPTAEVLFKDELCHLEVIRHAQDYDLLGTKHTFRWEEFLIKADKSLWSEMANAIARRVDDTIEYVVFLSNPRESPRANYRRFFVELRKKLEGATEIGHDQLLPTNVNGTIKIFTGDAAGKATLVIELIQQKDEFLKQAVEYLSDVVDCDVKGVVTLFGNPAFEPMSFAPIPTCTLLKLNLGVA